MVSDTQLLSLPESDYSGKDLTLAVYRTIQEFNTNNKCGATYKNIVEIIFSWTNKWSPESICREVRRLRELGIVQRFNIFSKRAAWYTKATMSPSSQTWRNGEIGNDNRKRKEEKGNKKRV
jgi:hypothetical protein